MTSQLDNASSQAHRIPDEIMPAATPDGAAHLISRPYSRSNEEVCGISFETRSEAAEGVQLSTLGQNAITRSTTNNTQERLFSEEDPSCLTPARLTIERDRGRAVKRRLRGIHIFMITVSGVLGIGLYVRGGAILRLGGPLAVLLSFSLVGVLAWGVMQCIAEMLCIWPISGALTVYVTEFVDVELGIAVGVAYWFTYSISFAALIAATAGQSDYWGTPKGIQGGVLFFIIPLFLVILNSFGVEAYGLFEVVGGALKLSFLLVVIVAMIAINQGAGPGQKIGTSLYPRSITVHDTDATKSWTQALFMSLSIATFAFVGVEITAASALEARVPTERAARPSTIGRTVKFSAVYISFLTACLYVLAGFLVTLNLNWDNEQLPRMSWIKVKETNENPRGTTASAFVLVAEISKIPGLAGTVNFFLIFTALTCANTNLYVASRTLFSLTRVLDGGPDQPLYTRFLALLGKTNKRKVPVRALLASCIFAWVPFLYLNKSHGPATSIGTLLDVLSEMGSVGVVIVWACECWAYIRFYHCVKRNKNALRDTPLVRRWDHGTNDLPDEFPYRGHGQPITAYLSLISCLFILLIANGASLWSGFHGQPFLSAYLAPICFLALWALLKVLRNGQWRLVDLSNGTDVAVKMSKLHESRFRSADILERRQKGVLNLWGIL